jgi:hypothetical protein
MSSLWTPGGEHPVDRPGTDQASPRATPPPTPPPTEAPERELTPEERAAAEEYARQVEEAREQLLAAPAGLVVGQQALQFYELAALHLSQPTPRTDEARVAIDALAAVVDAVGPRLGEAESALRQALTQLQMAVVEVSGRAGAGTAGDEPTAGDTTDGPTAGDG